MLLFFAGSAVEDAAFRAGIDSSPMQPDGAFGLPFADRPVGRPATVIDLPASQAALYRGREPGQYLLPVRVARQHLIRV